MLFEGFDPCSLVALSHSAPSQVTQHSPQTEASSSASVTWAVRQFLNLNDSQAIVCPSHSKPASLLPFNQSWPALRRPFYKQSQHAWHSTAQTHSIAHTAHTVGSRSLDICGCCMLRSAPAPMLPPTPAPAPCAPEVSDPDAVLEVSPVAPAASAAAPPAAAAVASPTPT